MKHWKYIILILKYYILRLFKKIFALKSINLIVIVLSLTLLFLIIVPNFFGRLPILLNWYRIENYTIIMKSDPRFDFNNYQIYVGGNIFKFNKDYNSEIKFPCKGEFFNLAISYKDSIIYTKIFLVKDIMNNIITVNDLRINEKSSTTIKRVQLNEQFTFKVSKKLNDLAIIKWQDRKNLDSLYFKKLNFSVDNQNILLEIQNE
jgi:hypothetical protein